MDSNSTGSDAGVRGRPDLPDARHSAALFRALTPRTHIEHRKQAERALDTRVQTAQRIARRQSASTQPSPVPLSPTFSPAHSPTLRTAATRQYMRLSSALSPQQSASAPLSHSGSASDLPEVFGVNVGAASLSPKAAPTPAIREGLSLTRLLPFIDTRGRPGAARAVSRSVLSPLDDDLMLAREKLREHAHMMKLQQLAATRYLP
jgi:hypothetical protein